MFVLELLILVITLLAGLYSMRGWWMSTDKPGTVMPDGSIEMRYSRNTFWLGFVSLMLGAGMMLSLSAMGMSIEAGLSLLVMGAALILAGTWLTFEYFNSRIVINARYIKKGGWLGGETIIDWSRLESIRFYAKTGNFVLESMDGEKVRVNRMMGGFDRFEELLNRHVPEHKIDSETLKDYRRIVELEQEILENFEDEDDRLEDFERKV